MQVLPINNVNSVNRNLKQPNTTNFKAHLSVESSAYGVVSDSAKFKNVMTEFGSWLEKQTPISSTLSVRKILSSPKTVPILVTYPCGPYGPYTKVESAVENLELSMDGRNVGFYFNSQHNEEELLNYFIQAYNTIR